MFASPISMARARLHNLPTDDSDKVSHLYRVSIHSSISLMFLRSSDVSTCFSGFFFRCSTLGEDLIWVSVSSNSFVSSIRVSL